MVSEMLVVEVVWLVLCVVGGRGLGVCLVVVVAVGGVGVWWLWWPSHA